MDAYRGENEMSNAYAAVSALLFAILAVMHLVRIIGRWSVVIGPNNVSMNVSWLALVVSALLSIWGFAQLALPKSSITIERPSDKDRADECAKEVEPTIVTISAQGFQDCKEKGHQTSGGLSD